LIQRASAIGSKSEKFSFSKGKITFGQQCRAITRELFQALVHQIRLLFTAGKDEKEITEILVPA